MTNHQIIEKTVTISGIKFRLIPVVEGNGGIIIVPENQRDQQRIMKNAKYLLEPIGD